MAVFVWSIYNGATFYIDVFGKRFQNELEQLKKDVAKWQTSPDVAGSPTMTAKGEDSGIPAQSLSMEPALGEEKRKSSFEKISLLDGKSTGSTGMEGGSEETVRERSVHS